MSESFTLQNTGRGQIAFMLNPPVHMEEGMPKHKRRKALRENVQSIVIPQAGSVDLVEKTGLSVDVLRHLPEVLTILRNPNVRWVEDVNAPTAPPAEEKPAPPPPPPVEAPKPAPVPDPPREAVPPPPPAPPVEEPKPAPEPEKAPEPAPAPAPAGLPPGAPPPPAAPPAAAPAVRMGTVKGGNTKTKGKQKP